jgi:hypothetical protein
MSEVSGYVEVTLHPTHGQTAVICIAVIVTVSKGRLSWQPMAFMNLMLCGRNRTPRSRIQDPVKQNSSLRNI